MTDKQRMIDQFELAYRAASTIVRNLWTASGDLIRSQQDYEKFKSYRVDIALDIYKTYHGQVSNGDLAIIQEHAKHAGYLGMSFDDQSIEGSNMIDIDKRGIVQSGAHLASVREWIQTRCVNGERVTWGSHEELKSAYFTVHELELLASEIARVAVKEERERLTSILRCATHHDSR